MAHPTNPANYPSFNFNVDEEPYFDTHQVDLASATYHQWTPQSESNVIMVPGPRASTRAGLDQLQGLQHESHVPNLSLLVPSGPVPRPRSARDNNTDPIARFYNSDAPWSSERMRSTGMAGPSSFSIDCGSYRDASGAGSDIESIAAPRSDSGYYTHPAHSVISNEPDRADQELPPEMFQMGNMNMHSAGSEPKEMFQLQPDQSSQYSGRSAGKEFKCERCDEVSKTRSDHKKHMLRHEKPHKCEIQNCRRAGKGFTTVNDLERHKKSVHRIKAWHNSYQCASDECRNKEKIWPRLDNFKQHIHRMHPKADGADLIRRSVYRPQERSPVTESLSVAPMDTSLAGIGTEKQFSGNDLDDPNSGISLTPDQDTGLHFFAPTSHEVAMDLSQMSADLAQPNDSRQQNPISPQEYRQDPASLSCSSGPSSQQDVMRLQALANVASSQPTPKTSDPTPLPQVSSAPQTKAEQQRQALHKFSKIVVEEIQKSTSTNSVELEDIVCRVLYGSTTYNKAGNTSSDSARASTESIDYMDPDLLTKSEAIKASQAISNLIKQSSRHSVSRPRQFSKGFSANMKTCEQCGTTLARSCDLKKHMKRHTRPYGCTYPKCHKRFGAKSDWKRHENSQHFQLEAYRCNEISASSQSTCGELFYRVELFQKHLSLEHNITCPTSIDRETRTRRIGKNGQGQFWCGFCKEIVRLREKRNAAWDERFDHIDHHFNKEKRSIEDWVCVEARKTKGEVLKEMDRCNFDDEDMGVYGVGETDNSPPPPSAAMQDELQSVDEEMPLTSAALAQAQAQVPNSNSSGLRKRQAPMDTSTSSRAPKRRRVLNRYCCSCQSGPWQYSLYLDCMNCQHHLCGTCTVVDGVASLDASLLLG